MGRLEFWGSLVFSPSVGFSPGFLGFSRFGPFARFLASAGQAPVRAFRSVAFVGPGRQARPFGGGRAFWLDPHRAPHRDRRPGCFALRPRCGPVRSLACSGVAGPSGSTPPGPPSGSASWLLRATPPVRPGRLVGGPVTDLHALWYHSLFSACPPGFCVSGLGFLWPRGFLDAVSFFPGVPQQPACSAHW